MPPTPRRPRAATPAPGERQSDSFQPRTFVFGMVAATVLLFAGITISPSAKPTLVQAAKPSTVQGPIVEDLGWSSSWRKEYHQRDREACGLPRVDHLLCINNVFMGSNDPIFDLKCNFTLEAVQEGVSGSKKIRLMDAVDPESPQGKFLQSWREQGIAIRSPDLYVRWMDDENSVVPSFSLREGIIYPHLADPTLVDYYERYYRLPLTKDEFTLRLVRAGGTPLAEDKHPDWLMVLALADKERQTWDNGDYPGSLQYTCINNKPQLILRPLDGYLFFNELASRASNAEGSDCGSYRHPPGHTAYSESDSKTGACVFVWGAGDKYAQVTMPVESPEYHVVATLVPPRDNGKDEF